MKSFLRHDDGKKVFYNLVGWLAGWCWGPASDQSDRARTIHNEPLWAVKVLADECDMARFDQQITHAQKHRRNDLSLKHLLVPLPDVNSQDWIWFKRKNLFDLKSRYSRSEILESTPTTRPENYQFFFLLNAKCFRNEKEVWSCVRPSLDNSFFSPNNIASLFYVAFSKPTSAWQDWCCLQSDFSDGKKV